MAAESRLDPIRLEVITGVLRSAQAEMEALLERTAMSPFIREKKDFFAGFFDAEGRLVIGTSLPLFGNILRPILAQYPAATMSPGDIYWYNDCYASEGGVSHSPDQVFASPVFVDDGLIGFAQSWAHFTDIGGMFPGSITPSATDIFQEGLIVPPVRLYKAGVLNEEVFRIFLRNSRFPEMTRGDARALTASVRLGERRLQEMAARFGAATVTEAFDRVIERTEHALRKWFRETFKEGTYRFTDTLDGDGHGGGPFNIRLELTASDNGISIDTTRSDDQAQGAINFLMHATVPKMMLGIYALSSDPTLLFNEGVMNAVEEVKVREGSILHPRFPAALGQRGNTLARLQSACWGLVNVATGGKGVASNSIYTINLFRGRDPRSGEPFLLSDGVAVGYGARSFADGIDAVYYVAQKNYPAEFIELSYPIRLLGYAINPDSGGPGRWRGGAGVIREYEVMADEVVLATRIDSIDHPPWGVAGGMAGRSGRYVLNPGTREERLLPVLADGIVLGRGDLLRVETGGGGGWGHPFDREPERVAGDVVGGFVSEASAREDYGVVVVPETGAVDQAATAEIRDERRWPTRLFHRREYFDRVEW